MKKDASDDSTDLLDALRASSKVERRDPYADAVARAATEAVRAAVAGDDAALLDAVSHLSPGERLNVYRAAQRISDVCGATANNHPNPNTPPLFALLVQRYELERIAWGIDALRYSWPHRAGGRSLPPKHEHKRLDFVRGDIRRQAALQGVQLPWEP